MSLVLSGDGSVGPLSATEVGYLDGVTSSVQGQLNGLGVWQTWTPVLSQGSTVSATINYAKYTRIGDLVIATAYLTPTGTGTTGLNVSVSLPVANATNSLRCGSGTIYDSSAGQSYATVSFLSSGTVLFIGDWSGGGAWGATPNAAIGSSDQVTFTAMYEAA